MDVLVVVWGIVWHRAGYLDIQVSSVVKLILEFMPMNVTH